MAKEQQPSGVQGKGPSEENGKKGGQIKEEVAEGLCRCKEVSKKTVPEMLRLMVSDLAFWKRAGKKK